MIAAAHHSMMEKAKPSGVPFVECLNNTTCLCHTDTLSHNSDYSFSAWLNLNSSQPSLSEGRTLCFVGKRTSTALNGVEFGLTYRNSQYQAMGAFVQGSGVSPKYWSYQQYLGSWHNVVVTYTSNSCKTYIDGVLKNTNGGARHAITDARFSVACLNWSGSIISGGPMGKYANVAFWNKILSTSEVSDVASSIMYKPTDAPHRYDMNIQNGKIADVGTVGGWDFTTIQDFDNGIYIL